MDAAVRQVYGNPSSTHRAGQAAREHLERARHVIAGAVHAGPAEIVLTSGGTESNNLAIFGLLRQFSARRRHVVTTKIEHPSVTECCRQLEREGVEVTYVDVGREGVVDAAEIIHSIRPYTLLVSMMHANNETGVVQPVQEIAQGVQALRVSGQQIFFHSDGVQAVGKTGVDVRTLGIDLYSMSAHKVFGPKGVGALFVRRGVPLPGVQFGGRHERERRAGTENVPGVLAFARALELCDGGYDGVRALRDYFESELLRRIPDAVANGADAPRLPNTSNLLFRGVPAEAVVIALDLRGMAVSTGSACSSGSVEPSHVLLAMGRSRDEAKSSVRFSFGRYNTRDEVGQLIDAIDSCVSRLRASRPVETELVT